MRRDETGESRGGGENLGGRFSVETVSRDDDGLAGVRGRRSINFTVGVGNREQAGVVGEAG